MHSHLKERKGQNIHRSLIGVVRPSEYFIKLVNRNVLGNVVMQTSFVLEGLMTQ
jgi:hypothetical protein